MAEKVLKKLKMEEEEEGKKLSITEGGKEGKSKATASCKYLELKFQKCSKKKEVALETNVENLGVDLRMSTKQLGAKEKPRRKKCDVRFSLIRKHRIFQKNYRRTGVRQFAEDGLGPCESVERRSSWRCANGKAQVEGTTGGQQQARRNRRRSHHSRK